jgi:hypothetical protein
MITVKRVNLKDLIRSSEDKIFSVVFIKKNGEERHMVARLGVKKGVTGKGVNYKNPLEQPYMNVFDMKKNAWRKINLDTIKKLKIKGVEYEVID